LFIVTQTTSLRDRAEGAFAAELLAPAAGVESFLSDHVDDEDRERAAQHFGVSTRVIDHQLENHLGVSASW
jgi:Zn-dependent peptidase ImmA (M78 family)